MRYVREPYRIHPRDEVNTGIFARLDWAIPQAIRTLEVGSLLRRFLEYVMDTVDVERYADIQLRWTDPSLEDRTRVKFLAFVFYVGHKVAQIRTLDLDRSPALRLLDLGCGPGHVMMLAQFLGHEVVGLDRPDRELFDQICECFHVHKVDHMIVPGDWLPDLGRFDLITSTLTQFDACEISWSVDDWQKFMMVLANTLNADGRFYFTGSTRARPPSVCKFLRDRASWTSEHNALIFRPATMLADR